MAAIGDLCYPQETWLRTPIKTSWVIPVCFANY